jgi:hypothetical protein
MAANSQQQRRGRGKPFAKGQSGNPSGRPKEIGHVRDLARAYTRESIETLAKIMQDDAAPHASRVAASSSLLDRAWGKPTQPVSGEDGKDLFPAKITFEFVDAGG